MLISYKTEIKPTIKQIIKINQTIGVCRFVYNKYLEYNKKVYEIDKKFISAYDFSKYINNDFIHNNLEYSWIKDVSSKARRQSILNAERAFKRFFNKKSKFPKFKKKNKSNVKMYFVKVSKLQLIKCERHRIKIDTLGWVRLKEKGYLPTNEIIKFGTISKRANRYFISITIDKDIKPLDCNNEGIGIDLGIKNLVTCSNGLIKGNTNKTTKIKKLNKSLKRQQRDLSRKYLKNKKKGNTKNIIKKLDKIQTLHCRISNIRSDYQNKIINELVRTKPTYITIEDLNVSGMMKNRHLSKSIQNQSFNDFRNKLILKSKLIGFEVRIADRFYPSSKTCSNCGSIKQDLKLKDRIYKCNHCNLELDRDYNASLNLKYAIKYKVA
jgi:transposase, IS605 OrfB family, central region